LQNIFCESVVMRDRSNEHHSKYNSLRGKYIGQPSTNLKVFGFAADRCIL